MTCAYRLVDGVRYFVVCDGGKIYNKRQWSPEDEMIKPYYEHAGITIYHGVDRVYLQYEYWTQKGIQANSSTHRKAKTLRERSSKLEGVWDCRKIRTQQGVALVPRATMRKVREVAQRTPSSGRGHFKQLSGECSIPLSEMPHARGWAI